MKIWLRNRDFWEKAVTLLLGIGVVVVGLTFQDYGVSWDDEYSRYHGADFVRWYASGFRDRLVLSRVGNEYIYSHFFTGPAAIFAFLSPLRPYESIHLAIALVALLGLFVSFRVGQQLGGSRAGFLSALILALTPTYYGHSFINSKDLPFAVFYLAALYFLLKAYDHLPKPGLRRIVMTGVAVGLPLAIRVGGVMVLGYVAVLGVFWQIAQTRKRSSYRLGDLVRDIRHTVPALVAICLIAWLVMIVWWPFAQIDPIRNPLYAIAKSTSFDGAGFTNLFRGEFILSSMMPREYLMVMLLVTLPEFYGLGIAAALIAAITWTVRAAREGKVTAVDHQTKLGFFVFTAFFPIAAAVLMRPTVYDGTRLFLFVIPPLAILAALGLNWFFSLALPPFLKPLAGMLLLLVGSLVVADMFRTHPYQYAYFNRTSGGLPEAYGRFDTDYWGTSYKEGVDWLSRYYKPNAPRASIGVANPSNPFLTAYYVESGKPETRRFRHADVREDPEIVLSITRWNQHLIYGGNVLHIVQRMGVPLLYVIESTSSGTSEDSTMKFGLDRLHNHRDPAGAARAFRKVLVANPRHYGATSSLAVALEHTGQPAEAHALWARVLEMANQYKDENTAQTAMEKLRR